jgi:hypothetical protein
MPWKRMTGFIVPDFVPVCHVVVQRTKTDQLCIDNKTGQHGFPHIAPSTL